MNYNRFYNRDMRTRSTFNNLVRKQFWGYNPSSDPPHWAPCPMPAECRLYTTNQQDWFTFRDCIVYSDYRKTTVKRP